MDDWTEKYRPKTLTDVVGNEQALATLRTWARRWTSSGVPKKRAVILSGKPGTGKTSSALALASEFGWISIELNASDARNAVMIKKVATSGAIHETFDTQGRFLSSQQGGRKLIILDEADNLYERVEKSARSSGMTDLSDRGGKKAILETIRMTSQPIILIVNDYYALVRGGGEGFKDLCLVIPFYQVGDRQIVELLRRICREENLTVEARVLQLIAERCHGDVRSAVNDLQSLSLGRGKIDISSVEVLGYRDRDKLIFDAVRDVFTGDTLKSVRGVCDGVDIEPTTFLLWIAENLPRQYQMVADLARGYEMVSKADVFFGRVYRRRYYGLWSYASDLMTGGVTTAKTHTYSPVRYAPPQWMKEMKQSKGQREVRDALAMKLGRYMHNSKKKSKEIFFPQFKNVFCHDTRFACIMKQRLDLTESEIKFLLGSEHASKLKEILEFCEHVDETQSMLETVGSSEQEKKEENHEQKAEMKQPSLFDF
ncbi:MAG: replication factor C large subunit [Methanobacteriota archaeon]